MPKVDLGTAGWEGRNVPLGGGPVLCSCPRPKALAKTRRRQAGRQAGYLGLRQGLTLPGWLFAGMTREGKGK